MWESAVVVAIMTLGIDPEAGISESLALQRADQIANLRYSLDLMVPVAKTEPLIGKARLQYEL